MSFFKHYLAGFFLLKRSLRLPLLYVLLGVASAAMASGSDFSGVIGKELDSSVPSWPVTKLPPENAPNIIIWVIDDAGIAHIGAFGGEIETPNLDRLAEEGLRFTNFHAAPVCSASRAALLTGRNPHKVHMGSHAGAAIGFPGYDAHIPTSMGTIAHTLKASGYVTYALGKWDHLPSEHASAAGPFGFWPSGQGFDRFYGFLAADTDNFDPPLWSDHTPVDSSGLSDDYHLSKDMADKAIEWVASRTVRPEAPPFFLYWATGAIHAPHHAPDDMLEHYRGRFDKGWDVAREAILERQKALGIVPQETRLPPRPEEMPPWASLDSEQRQLYARAMEALAAQLTYTDQQFGRILDYLSSTGELENTVIVVVSDNGASAEGGLHGSFSEHMFFNGRFPSVAENKRFLDAWGKTGTYPHVPLGWAVVGNTPFRYYKQTAYEGGTRVPMIFFHPKSSSEPGGVRHQFHFISDITPTLLSVAKVEIPDVLNGVRQEPFDGVDMSYAFGDSDAVTRREVQYIENSGNRAVYHNGWKAVNGHRVKTWELPEHASLHDRWELYHLDNDVNEMEDLASSHPGRLQEMKELFDKKAESNNVYPIASSPGALGKLMMGRQFQRILERKGEFLYTQPVSRIPETLAPRLSDFSYDMTATIEVDQEGGASVSGPVFAVGGNLGGVTLFLKDGVVHYLYRNVDNTESQLAAQHPVPAGVSVIDLKYRVVGHAASAELSVNNELVGTLEIPGPLARTFSLHETFDIGSDTGTTVSPTYRENPVFQQKIKQLRFSMKLD